MPSATRGWSGARYTVLGIVGLAAVALAVYWPSLSGGFLWDDDALVTANALVKAPDGLYRMWFTTQAVDYWPVTNSSFWFEWRLWGLNPIGYHVTNVLLHAANAALALLILDRLAIPGARLAALIFIVHPVNVESVAWIAQRKNTLSLFFLLLSLLWYLTDEIRADQRHKGVTWRYVLSVVAFALAMLSKGSVVVLPAVILLMAWWRVGRVTVRDLLRAVPYAAIGAALTGVTIWFQNRGAHEAIRDVTWLQRLLAAPAAVCFYLSKALVPINLSFVYPQWDIQVRNLLWWCPLVAAVAVTVILVFQRHRPWARPLLFLWAFYVIALIPVMGFTDVYFMKYSVVADHYQYIALLGISAGAGALLSRALARAQAVVGA